MRVGLTIGDLGAEHSNVMPATGEGAADILNVDRCPATVVWRIGLGNVPDAQDFAFSD